MLLDFDDYHPETPRITSPITVREGVLLSLVVHLLVVIALLVAPKSWFEPSPEQIAAMELQQQQQQPLRFVEVVPLRDLPAPPRAEADASDMDRRATTLERPLLPENRAPLSRGNTPEPIVGGPTEPAAAPGRPGAPAPPASDAPAPPLPESTREALSLPAERPSAVSARQPPGNQGNLFSNPERYLRDRNFENSRGGDADQTADFQFDTMGVDFGPWLLYFKRQVEGNWTVPAAIQSFSGRTVIRFGVLRNGTIVGITVIQPGPIPALTQSAIAALKLSSPTRRLPDEYPVEPAVITATFHFNDFPQYVR